MLMNKEVQENFLWGFAANHLSANIESHNLKLLMLN